MKQFKNRQALYDKLSETGYPVYYKMSDANERDNVYIVFNRVNGAPDIRRDNQNHIRTMTIQIELYSRDSTVNIEDVMRDIDADFVSYEYVKDTMQHVDTYQADVYINVL